MVITPAPTSARPPGERGAAPTDASATAAAGRGRLLAERPRFGRTSGSLPRSDGQQAGRRQSPLDHRVWDLRAPGCAHVPETETVITPGRAGHPQDTAQTEAAGPEATRMTIRRGAHLAGQAREEARTAATRSPTCHS